MKYLELTIAALAGITALPLVWLWAYYEFYKRFDSTWKAKLSALATAAVITFTGVLFTLVAYKVLSFVFEAMTFALDKIGT